MADHDIQSMEKLLSALRADAAECFSHPELVTIDFGKVTSADPSGAEVTIERLKASSRLCFLNAKLGENDAVFFTARAVFKAGSGLEESK